MVKKIIIYTICLVLALTICAFAANAANTIPAEPSQRVPQERTEGMKPPEGGKPHGVIADGGELPQEIPENIKTGQETENTQNNNEIPAEENEQHTNENSDRNIQPQADWNGREGNMKPPNFGMEQNIQDEKLTFYTAVKKYATPITSLVLLVFAFVFVKVYKKKNY